MDNIEWKSQVSNQSMLLLPPIPYFKEKVRTGKTALKKGEITEKYSEAKQLNIQRNAIVQLYEKLGYDLPLEMKELDDYMKSKGF